MFLVWISDYYHYCYYYYYYYCHLNAIFTNYYCPPPGIISYLPTLPVFLGVSKFFNKFPMTFFKIFHYFHYFRGVKKYNKTRNGFSALI